MEGRWGDTFTTSSPGDGFVLGGNNKLCEMWILLEKHRAEFGVHCYLLQAVVQLVADLIWP